MPQTTTGRKAPSDPSAYAALCLGFGCFFAVCPFSALGTNSMRYAGMGWQEIMLCRVAFLVSAAACFAVRRNKGARWYLPAPLRTENPRLPIAEVILGIVTVMAGFAILALRPEPISPETLALVAGCLVGLAFAVFGGQWFKAFFAVRRLKGRTACMVGFACSFLATVLITWLANLMGMDEINLLISVAILMAASGGLLIVVARMTRPTHSQPSDGPRDFMPSTYARTLLLGTGASWALTYNVTIELGYGTGPDQFVRWALTLVFCGILLVLTMVFVRKVDIGEVRFGLMLRWVVTAIGCLWAFMPALAEAAPIVAGVLHIMVFWLQLTVFLVFVMEVCLEGSLPFHQVLARYFVIFSTAACAGSLVFWLLKTGVTDTHVMWSLLGGLGAACSLLIIPFLPSRGSNANVFTLERFPEDKDAEERNARARRCIAEEHGFTARETEVFELLMHGLTRDEVADRLEISPWTVKNHIRAVFAKTGTHSTKELMALVYDGDE